MDSTGRGGRCAGYSNPGTDYRPQRVFSLSGALACPQSVCVNQRLPAGSWHWEEAVTS